VEHLPKRKLSVEDVPADQPVLLLHLVRPDHLPVQHRIGEPRRDFLHPGEYPVGVGLQVGVVRRVGVAAGHPLGEHRHDVLTGRRQ
jgi:hypothetical protein